MKTMKDVNEYIAHHGIKGMKWGERKAAREEHKQWQKDARSPETANKVFQDAVKSFTPTLAPLRKDPAFADMATNPKTRRQYDAVVSTLFNQHLAQSSAQTINPKTGRAMIYQMTPDGTHMRAIESMIVGVEHADIQVAPSFKLVRDKDGFITNVVFEEDSIMQFDMNDVDAYLDHHGIKGMRWGVRRKSRQNDEAKARSTRSKAKRLTDDELNNAVKRLELEKRYIDLNSKTSHAGKQYAQSILDSAGKTVAATIVGTSAAFFVKKALKAKFDVAD